MATNDAGNREPLIFPIGHYVGAFYGEVGSQQHQQRVMLGADVQRLTDEQLAVWLLARGVPEQIGDVPWTRKALEEVAGKAGVTDPDRVVSALIAEGLLAETVPGTEHSVDFAEAYRLMPLMLGLGNSPEEPWLQAIGFFEQPVLKVANEIYSMWEWANVDNNLWAACYAYADTSKRAGETDPEETVPELILTGFLGTLHALLAASAAYLDLARLEQPAERSA
jgi:hypothetical protein